MTRYGVLLVVAGAMLWGTDSLFRRPLTRELSPITIVFLEHVVLCVIALPVVVRGRRIMGAFGSPDWFALAFIALGGSVAATSLFTFSIKYGNPSVTILLQKTQPFFTITLARWFLRERPGPWFWHCLIPALTGAYLVAVRDWRSGFSLGSSEPESIAAALGAALFWGCSTVFGRYIVAKTPTLLLTSLRFVLALPALGLLYLIQSQADRRLPSDLASARSVVAMALIPGLLALVLYYRGLRFTKAAAASIGELAFPITAVIANWLLLDTRLTVSQLIGGALLVSSVTLLNYLESQSRGPRKTDPDNPEISI